MSNVYVLELENNKFYIGKTNNVDRRFEEHVRGYGSAWTRKYKPIQIKEVMYDCDGFDEDKITVKYMMKYGIDNARGGPFVSIHLPPETIYHINIRIRMASNLCVKCGSSGHYVTECTEKIEKIKYVSTDYCSVCMSCTHFTEDCTEFS